MIERTLDHFDPFLIAESGQCFRIARTAPDVVTACEGDKRVRVTALGGERFRFDCTPEEMDAVWARYFDLDTDYARILAEAGEHGEPLLSAARMCGGLRILRQSPWEALICFILSQRKSIPAIAGCVAKLCERFGRRVNAGQTDHSVLSATEPLPRPDPPERCFAFPTPERLAAADAEALAACGVGYRAAYLLDAARRVASGALELEALNALPDEELLARLSEVHGVGLKVSSCTALFGYHRLRVSPVDVWIQRVIDKDYHGVSPFEGFGGYAGVFQQYLFIAALRQKRAG